MPTREPPGRDPPHHAVRRAARAECHVILRPVREPIPAFADRSMDCKDCVVLPWRCESPGSPSPVHRCFSERSEGGWLFGCFSVTCDEGTGHVEQRGYSVKLQQSQGFCGRNQDKISFIVANRSLDVQCVAFAEVCGESNSDYEQIFLLILIVVVAFFLLVTGLTMVLRAFYRRRDRRERSQTKRSSKECSSTRASSGSFCSSVPGEGGAGSLRPFSSRSGVPKTLVWPPEESSQRSEAPQVKENRRTEISL